MVKITKEQELTLATNIAFFVSGLIVAGLSLLVVTHPEDTWMGHSLAIAWVGSIIFFFWLSKKEKLWDTNIIGTIFVIILGPVSILTVAFVGLYMTYFEKKAP